jgi:hypothetical protein
MKSFTFLTVLLQCMSVALAHGDHYHRLHHQSRGLHFNLGQVAGFQPNQESSDHQITPDLCGTPEQTEEKLEKQKAVLSLFRSTEDGSRRVESLCERCINIDTYFHILTDDHKTKGNYDDEKILDQMKILNDGFKQTPFTFNLINITRTHDTSLFDLGQGFNNDYVSMQSALGEKLRKGDRMTLNIYSIQLLPRTLGLATYPSGFDGRKDAAYVDHCTLPDGSCPLYNSGKILVHEVGHWLGLLHVFQGGCDEIHGDYVSDTPPQSSAIWGCQSETNSCPANEGNDPLDNFMGCKSNNLEDQGCWIGFDQNSQCCSIPLLCY